MEIRDHLREGYREWVKRNETAAQEAYGDFQELRDIQTSVRERISRFSHLKSGQEMSTDLLISGTQLSSSQKERLRQLSSTVHRIDSFSELREKLEQFDVQTVRILDRDSRKVILQITALLRAQSEFLEGVDPADALGLVSQTNSSGTRTKLGDDGSENPPQLEDYINEGEIARETLLGALTGAGAGTVCGPATKICSAALAVGGALVGGVGTYSAQMNDYQRDLATWCRTKTHRYCDERLP